MNRLRIKHHLNGSLVIISFLALLGGGCQSYDPNMKKLHSELPEESSPELTLGVFQSKIVTGMSQGEVAAAVGSPNIVEKRDDNKEVWIYDKVSSEVASVNQRVSGGGGAGMAVATGSAIIGGIGGVSGGKNASVSRSTQKSLTVVITFEDGQVSDTQYHMSQF